MSGSGKIKVVFLINSLGGGGAEKIMTLLLENLDREKFDISLCLTSDDRVEYQLDPMIPLHIPKFAQVHLPPMLAFALRICSLARCIVPLERIAEMRSKYVNVRNTLTHICTCYLATRRYVEAVKPQILVSFLFHSSMIAIILKIFSKEKVKTICSDHCTLTKDLKNYFPLSYIHLPRLLYKGLDAYVSVSEGVKQDLVENYHVSSERIRVIYNGIDTVKIKKLASCPVTPAVEVFFPADNVFSIVNVGRLAPPKSQSVLLKAFQIVRKSRLCKLYLVGQGGLFSELSALSQELGIENDVHFLGWQENPYSIMAKCDLFVLSSSWEAFPNVLVEAMSVGLPIVSTDCPTGPREALADGVYGDLVPINDAEALARAICRMYDDEPRRQEFARRGIERAEVFTLSHMVDAYQSLLHELATKGQDQGGNVPERWEA